MDNLDELSPGLLLEKNAKTNASSDVFPWSQILKREFFTFENGKFPFEMEIKNFHFVSEVFTPKFSRENLGRLGVETK